MAKEKCRVCCAPREPHFLKDNKSAMLHWKMRNIEHTRMCIINEMFSQREICYTHPRILGEIKRHGSITQTELAGIMNTSTAAMSTTVKVLLKQGLITKSVDESDLRVNKITLTEKGKQIHDATLAEMLDIDKHLLDGFNDGEADLLLDMLSRVQQNLNNLTDKQGEKND